VKKRKKKEEKKKDRRNHRTKILISWGGHNQQPMFILDQQGLWGFLTD